MGVAGCISNVLQKCGSGGAFVPLQIPTLPAGGIPPPPAPAPFARRIDAGYQHAVAVRADGTIAQWGGTDDQSTQNLPTDGGYVGISADNVNTIAIKADGTLRYWGGGQPAPVVPATGGFVKAVVGASGVALGLKTDGTIQQFGGSTSGAPAAGEKFVDIAAGNTHLAAIKPDGTIVVWGSTAIPGKPTPTTGGHVALAIGARHAVAIKTDGTLEQWGANNSDQDVDLPTDCCYVAVACGDHHTLGLKTDGTIVQWGASSFNQRQDFPTTGKYLAVACGDNSCMALRSDGVVVQWGNTTGGERANAPTGPVASPAAAWP
jgi:alpha-tubulin suppressor-like RCC1 family protein